MTPPAARHTHTVELPAADLRLAASRQRLLSYMAQGNDNAPKQDTLEGRLPEGARDVPKNAALQALTRTVQAWWRHHPAKIALEIAQPTLSQYAKDKPLQLLGISAAVGAAAVLVRPWRLVSVTGLLLATIKSSGLANVALSMVSAQTRKGAQPHQETTH